MPYGSSEFPMYPLDEEEKSAPTPADALAEAVEKYLQGHIDGIALMAAIWRYRESRKKKL